MEFEYTICSFDGIPLTSGKINAESENEAIKYAEEQCFGDLENYHISVEPLD